MLLILPHRTSSAASLDCPDNAHNAEHPTSVGSKHKSVNAGLLSLPVPDRKKQDYGCSTNKTRLFCLDV